MQISPWWFRFRKESTLSDKVYISLIGKPGYSVHCRCDSCGQEFNRSFGVIDFSFCKPCLSSSRLAKIAKGDRTKAKEKMRAKWHDPEFMAKFKNACRIRSSNPEYLQKLRKSVVRGKEHATKTSCGARGLDASGFVDFASDIDTLDRQRCRNTVGKECLQKAEYICSVCRRAGNVNAHHLNGWHWAIEQRFELQNLVCLCVECHKTFHSIYGRKNNTREQFEEFRTHSQRDRIESNGPTR